MAETSRSLRALVAVHPFAPHPGASRHQQTGDAGSLSNKGNLATTKNANQASAD